MSTGRVWVAVILALGSAVGQGESRRHLPQELLDACTNSQFCVYGGHRFEEVGMDPWQTPSVALVGDISLAETQTCTGFVVEGCIITAAHCDEGDISVFGGEDLNEPGKAHRIGWIKNKRVLKKPTDIAILKPFHPLPEALSLSFSMLASTPFEGVENETVVVGEGFGHSETREEKDPKTGKFVRRDYGIGTKRIGKFTFFKKKDGLLLFNRARSSQILAKGDSGGPMLFDKKIIAVAHAVQTETFGPGQLVTSEDDLRGADGVIGQGTPIAEHLEEIKQLMGPDELDCKVETENAALPLQVFLEAAFPEPAKAKDIWQSDKQWRKGGMAREILQVMLDNEFKSMGLIGGTWKTVEFAIDSTKDEVIINWRGLADTDPLKEKEILKGLRDKLRSKLKPKKLEEHFKRPEGSLHLEFTAPIPPKT